MNKLLMTAGLSLLLASCGSSPKKESFLTENRTASGNDGKVSGQKTEPNPLPDKKPEPAVSSPAAAEMKQAELDQAVASGDEERIRKASQEMLQFNSKNSKALNALAMWHYKRQQYEAAALLLNKALAANPNASEAYNNLGLIELAKNNRKEAISMFRKALQVNPENPYAAANAAAIYAREKDYSKVVLTLEKAVNNNKANASALNNYAIALVATGRHGDAASYYEKILKDNPDNKSYILNYSILLIEKQAKYKEGLDLVNRLKFVGTDNESRQVIKELENKAKAGLK